MTTSESAVRTEVTGRTIDGSRARELGVVNELVADIETVTAALALAEEIGANAPLALAAVKEVVRPFEGRPEPEAFSAQRAEIGDLMRSADFAEGSRAFSEKRAPQWTGK